VRGATAPLEENEAHDSKKMPARDDAPAGVCEPQRSLPHTRGGKGGSQASCPKRGGGQAAIFESRREGERLDAISTQGKTRHDGKKELHLRWQEAALLSSGEQRFFLRGPLEKNISKRGPPSDLLP